MAVRWMMALVEPPMAASRRMPLSVMRRHYVAGRIRLTTLHSWRTAWAFTGSQQCRLLTDNRWNHLWYILLRLIRSPIQDLRGIRAWAGRSQARYQINMTCSSLLSRLPLDKVDARDMDRNLASNRKGLYYA